MRLKTVVHVLLATTHILRAFSAAPRLRTAAGMHQAYRGTRTLDAIARAQISGQARTAALVPLFSSSRPVLLALLDTEGTPIVNCSAAT